LIETIKPGAEEKQEETAQNLDLNAVRPFILTVPIDDAVDELIAGMLANILPRSLRMESVSSQTLTGEVVERAEKENPAVVCLGALNPGGSAELKLLAKKLLALPTPVNVVIGRWGLLDSMRIRELASATGVQAIASTLSEARNMITQLMRISPQSIEPTPVERVTVLSEAGLN